MIEETPLDWGETMHIYTDGASRKNPGEAAAAYICATEDGEVFYGNQDYLGEATNNEAEYHGVILALDDAVGVHRGPLVLHSDSKLVINQLNGNWRVKAANLVGLYDEALTKMQRYDDLTLRYVPRENALLREVDSQCSSFLDDKIGNG